MPRELITIQVGQCGNQIGSQFWLKALQEHTIYDSSDKFTEELSSFFSLKNNTFPKFNPPINYKAEDLQARAVLIDTEEGVIGKTLKGPLQKLFSSDQIIKSNSGSGNNWAQGHNFYGPNVMNPFLDLLNHEIEKTDSLQGLLFTHSLGGGTGSGLGSYLLEIASEYHSLTDMITFSVYPSLEDDDVITSPYNSCFAVAKLLENANVSFSFDNASLIQKCVNDNLIKDPLKAQGLRNNEKPGTDSSPMTKIIKKMEKKETPFSAMNEQVANVISAITAGVRFPGSLNVDFGEMYTNLVPFPELHFVQASQVSLFKRDNPLIPLYCDQKVQLFSSLPHDNCILASALLYRGQFSISQINSDLNKFLEKRGLRTPQWTNGIFKIGNCDFSSSKTKSVCSIINSTGYGVYVDQMCSKFEKLFNRRVFVHHYTEEGLEESYFQETMEELRHLSDKYKQIADSSYM
eukprot:TRINITY_DN2219_c0_g1_i1.p1 TRINITY_DN2219_c0_g1~~TRINITY_DN2219_c0_g1_i1.p1  ORF type:complete len:461 (-),score=103.53 TRINITY_DN2219_c0_g1_i1:7-1389(-)